MYDGYAYSSSGSSLTIKDVQIGAQTINQDLINTIDKDITLSANSKAYICDKLSPMFGVKKDQKRGEVPGVAMQHLASIAAIKIVNKGDGGDIVVSSIEITAPEAIVGEFEIVITDNVSFTATNASSTARVELPSPTRIEYDKSITIYVPIKPFDASGKEITIAINGTAVKNNGVSRSVTMPANTKLQAGKVTTFTVSVNELSFHHKDVRPETSNVLDEEGTIFVKNGWKYEVTTGKLGVLSHPTPQPLIINGLPVNGYILGSESDCGHVTIRGTASELITYVPLEFYASSWNDTKAVMRVESITAYFESIRTPLTFTYDDLYPSIIKDKTKITFSGLLSLMQVVYDNKKHIVILDEEPYHKPVSIEKIEDLLQSFDDNKADNEQGKKPTYEGLKGALQNPSSLPSSSSPDLSSLTKQSDITATIVYLKLKEKLSSNIILKLVSAFLFRSPKSMFEMAADMPLEVKLSTVSKGTEGATDNRIVVWGLNSPNAND